MITIVDYRAGNIKSVVKAFEHLDEEVVVTDDPSKINSASTLVFPGQGSFGAGMTALKALNLLDSLRAYIESGRPFLGICLGFQLLFDSSEESDEHEGLGVFPGRVTMFDSPALKVPQMGWNRLEVCSDQPSLLQNLEPDSHVYFVHSYYAPDTDADWVAARTHYGAPFVSAVQQDMIFGTQFHPEKSGAVGLQILRNFLAASRG